MYVRILLSLHKFNSMSLVGLKGRVTNFYQHIQGNEHEMRAKKLFTAVY